jgi:hypothetical protein
MDFCPQCGGPLTTKEKPIPKEAASAKPEEKKPDARLICPSCKILYERMKTCVRCGTPLVTQSALREMEKSKPPQAPPQAPPPREEHAEARRKKPAPSHTPEVEQEPSPIELLGKPQPNELLDDSRKRPIAPGKRKKISLRSPIAIIGMIVLLGAAIYIFSSLLFSGKRSEVAIAPPTSTEPISASTEPQEKETGFKETLPSASIPVVSLAQEIEAIKGLLENVRQANLRKNIDLLMSCYALDFKDREGRRRATLETWRNFNFLDLTYVLKLDSVSIDSAKAKVEWRILIISRKGGQSEENRTFLDVTFQKENDEWKIKEVIPVS